MKEERATRAIPRAFFDAQRSFERVRAAADTAAARRRYSEKEGRVGVGSGGVGIPSASSAAAQRGSDVLRANRRADCRRSALDVRFGLARPDSFRRGPLNAPIP